MFVHLSSGEAEHYSALKRASMGLGMQLIAKDIGIELHLRLLTDSTAANGIIYRRALGKLRHLEVGYLWLQDQAANKKLKVL